MLQHGAAAELLAGVPLFRGIGSELLVAILHGGELLRFRSGDKLAAAGTPADGAFLIVSGEVGLRYADGRAHEQTLGPGMCLGDMAMLVETDNFYSAVAQDDVTAVKIHRAAMGQIMVRQPALAAQLARNITRNLAFTARTLSELDTLLDNPASGAGGAGSTEKASSETGNGASNGTADHGANGAADGSGMPGNGTEHTGQITLGEALGGLTRHFGGAGDGSSDGRDHSPPARDLLKELPPLNLR